MLIRINSDIIFSIYKYTKFDENKNLCPYISKWLKCKELKLTFLGYLMKPTYLNIDKRKKQRIKGRGAHQNPANRFYKIHYDPEVEEKQSGTPKQTEYYKDTSQSIITYNDSPDVSFGASINPYRGCEHGCIYCYARPNHEYFGLSAGLDFETKIFVKGDAPKLLNNELSRKNWKPQVLAMSGVTDPYQPLERKLKLSRKCLEVLLKFRNPVQIITKSELVIRDIDILSDLNRYQAAGVCVSVTSLNHHLAQIMEPRAASPNRRLATIQKLTTSGIPTGILIAPVIPGINDHEIPAILKAASVYGATSASYIIIRLPYAIKDIFDDWLNQHFPERQDRVLNRIRELRAGKLNDSEFHTRMRGNGTISEQISDLFEISRRKYGFGEKGLPLSIKAFRNPYNRQMSLF